MLSLRRFDWTLHMATIALCTYFLSRAVMTYVGGILESVPRSVEAPAVKPAATESTQESKASLDDYKIVTERNIFNSTEEATSENLADQKNLPLGELGPAVKTSLDVKVVSTLVIGEGTDRRSSAVVSGGKGSKGNDVYYPGDENSFAPNVKLTKVEKDKIEFINGGRLEFAELEDITQKSIFASAEEVHGKGGLPSKEKAEPKDSGGGKIVVDQREIDEALQNLDKLMTEVRIVPNFQGGQPAGMKVLSVKPGSIISKLGVARGDILEKVNGQALDIKTGMDLFNQMKDMKNFSLEVTRGGKNQTLEYEIK